MKGRIEIHTSYMEMSKVPDERAVTTKEWVFDVILEADRTLFLVK